MLAASALALPGIARAQEFPTRPIKLLVEGARYAEVIRAAKVPLN
jgi:hypothetical protein